MIALRKALGDYLALRRGLGTELAAGGAALHQFVEFLERQGARHVSLDLALRWAIQPIGVQPVTWAARLGHVRRFASWLSAIDPRTEVPPLKLLPYRHHRKSPYIYSDEEITRLVRAAARLPSPHGLRGLSLATLYGLLAATGLRLGEALALDELDVDLGVGILTIRRAKFGKSRFIPVHESTRRALKDYVTSRNELLHRHTHAFFLSDRGGRLSQYSARYNFAKVSREVGLRRSVGGYRQGHGPRLHDMRHRFAAKRMVEWYRTGVDVERQMPRLATYLGHVHVNQTYWYIEAVPELLQLATERLMHGRQEVEP
jgi:integrase/recombinase XerD